MKKEMPRRPLAAGDWSVFFGVVPSLAFLGRPGPAFLAVAAEELGAAATEGVFAPGLADGAALASGVWPTAVAS
jgi:hypothetical protein